MVKQAPEGVCVYVSRSFLVDEKTLFVSVACISMEILFFYDDDFASEQVNSCRDKTSAASINFSWTTVSLSS